MHSDVIKILKREAESMGQGLIRIHRENNKWYAYEQSAFLLSEMVKGQAILSRYMVNEWLWLARAEINIEQIPYKYIICYDQNEYILRYIPSMSFYEWILKLG